MKRGLFLYGINCTLAIWNEQFDFIVGHSMGVKQSPHSRDYDNKVG